MKKTLQECKEEIAKEYGYKNWEYLVSNNPSQQAFSNEVAERYAIQYKQPFDCSEEEKKVIEKINWPYVYNDESLILSTAEQRLFNIIKVKLLNAALQFQTPIESVTNYVITDSEGKTLIEGQDYKIVPIC